MDEEQAIAKAKEMYTANSDGSIEIDDTATVLYVVEAGGQWVQAWVWVPNE